MSSDSDPSMGMTYYDIAFRKPYHVHSAAPNPWKGRYSLNFKGVPYKTHWTPMLDITSTRKALGVPPCRTFPDGSEYYTLPVLIDNRGDGQVSKLGDSFDIAVYLDQTYPNSGAGQLIPDDVDLDYTCPIDISFNGPPLSDRPEWREQEKYKPWVRFNDQIDNAFTLHVQLMGSGMKWDQDQEEGIKVQFASRAGVDNFDKLQVRDKEGRTKLLASLKDTLKHLAAMFGKNGGPYLRGEKACYADIIVGGWLRMMSVTLPEDEWAEVKGWYDGVFGRLHDCLQREFGEVK